MDETLPTRQIISSKQMLVEGRDDQLFFEALVAYIGIDEMEVRPYNGKTNLRPFLRSFAATPGFSQVVSLGVVRDADMYPTRALQSVRDSLVAANLPCPVTSLSPAGDKPKVTVFIVPDDHTPGELEDICLGAVNVDPAMDCVVKYMSCVNSTVASPPEEHSKAMVHAFLASRQRPDLRLGEAAQAGYWPWDSPAFARVKRFVQTL